MLRRTLSAVSIGLLLGVSGCIPLPFLTPPVTVSIGGAARRGLPKSLEGDNSPVIMRLDAGVRPFQIMEDWTSRRADMGVGYAFEMGAGPTLHCAYAEGAIFPFVGDVGRMGVHLQPRVLFDANDGRPSFGITTRITGELRSFVSKPFVDTSGKGGAIGYAHGEGGAALYLEGAYERVYDIPTMVIGLGITFRIPAMIGVAFVPIY